MGILPTTYFPSHEANRMKSEGDIIAARDRFFNERSTNLRFLLDQRYSWMNEQIRDSKKVIEVGSGAGFSKEFIHHPDFRLTDVTSSPWIDQYVDALQMPFEDGSLDAIIC